MNGAPGIAETNASGIGVVMQSWYWIALGLCLVFPQSRTQGPSVAA